MGVGSLASVANKSGHIHDPNFDPGGVVPSDEIRGVGMGGRGGINHGHARVLELKEIVVFN